MGVIAILCIYGQNSDAIWVKMAYSIINSLMGAAKYGLCALMVYGIYMQLSHKWHPYRFGYVGLCILCISVIMSCFNPARFGMIAYYISSTAIKFVDVWITILIAAIPLIIPFFRGRSQVVAAYARYRQGGIRQVLAGQRQMATSRVGNNQRNFIDSRTAEPPTRIISSPARQTITVNPEMRSIQGVFQDYNVPARAVGVRECNSAWKYYIDIDRGCRVDQVENRVKEIALVLKQDVGRVSFGENENGKLVLYVNKPVNKSQIIDFQLLLDDKVFMNNPLLIPVGIDTNGLPINIDVFKKAHLIIGGGSGSGKTSWLHTMIMSLAYKNNPDDLQIMLIDVVKHEMNLMNDLPHLVRNIQDENDIPSAIEFIMKEMKRRQDVMAKDSLTNFVPFMLVIDEIDTIINDYPEINEVLVKAARISRGLNFLIVLASQRPDGNAIDKTITCNFQCKICLKVGTDKESQIILGNGYRQAEKLGAPGDLYLKYNGDFIRGKGYYINPDGIRNRVAGIINRLQQDNDVNDNIINGWSLSSNIIPFIKNKFVNSTNDIPDVILSGNEKIQDSDRTPDSEEWLESVQDGQTDSRTDGRTDSKSEDFLNSEDEKIPGRTENIEERNAKIIRLYRQNSSIRSTAQAFGLSKSVVGEVIKKYKDGLIDYADEG